MKMWISFLPQKLSRQQRRDRPGVGVEGRRRRKDSNSRETECGGYL